MKIRLIRATAADAPAIRALTRSAYAKWVPVIGREPKPMQADFDRAAREHLIDLLFAGEALAGLIEMIPGADRLLIENLAVAPAWQGRGLGRQLMTHAENLARTLGVGHLRLYTNQRFASNLAFYLRLGFSVEREEPFMDGTVVHMGKAL